MVRVTGGPSRAPLGYVRQASVRRASGRLVEHVGGDQLLEVAVAPPRQLQLLGPPEVELDVVLQREADAPEDLLADRSHVAKRLTGEQLGHRREPADVATLGPGP